MKRDHNKLKDTCNNKAKNFSNEIIERSLTKFIPLSFTRIPIVLNHKFRNVTNVNLKL